MAQNESIIGLTSNQRILFSKVSSSDGDDDNQFTKGEPVTEKCFPIILTLCVYD